MLCVCIMCGVDMCSMHMVGVYVVGFFPHAYGFPTPPHCALYVLSLHYCLQIPYTLHTPYTHTHTYTHTPSPPTQAINSNAITTLLAHVRPTAVTTVATQCAAARCLSGLMVDDDARQRALQADALSLLIGRCCGWVYVVCWVCWLDVEC